MALSAYANTYIDPDNPYPQALNEAVTEAGGFTAEDQEELYRRERIRALREGENQKMDWASQADRALTRTMGGMEQKRARDAGVAYGGKVMGVGKAAQAKARAAQASKILGSAQGRMGLGSGLPAGFDPREYDMS